VHTTEAADSRKPRKNHDRRGFWAPLRMPGRPEKNDLPPWQTPKSSTQRLLFGADKCASVELRKADLIRLQSDLGKLKLIGVLFPKDLEALFERLDPRTASRRQVDAAVLAIWEHYLFSRVPEGERNRVQ
jgi:hypothetical protein